MRGLLFDRILGLEFSGLGAAVDYQRQFSLNRVT